MAKKALYDTSYFEKIDTEEKAYFLGLISADGYMKKYRINDTKVTHTVSINSNANDSEMIFVLGDKLNIKPKFKEYFDDRIDKNKVYRNYHIKLGARKTYEDLLQWFKFEKKLKRNFPNIDNNLRNHFIRGYFDGDGCISKRKNSNVYSIDFSGSKSMLLSIIENLQLDLKIEKMKSIHRFRTNKISKVESIVRYMYKNSYVFLNRKYKIVEDFAASKKLGKIREGWNVNPERA